MNSRAASILLRVAVQLESSGARVEDRELRRRVWEAAHYLFGSVPARAVVDLTETTLAVAPRVPPGSSWREYARIIRAQCEGA